MQNENSVTIWIDAVRRGDSVAAEALWSRYFEQLLRQARRRMTSLPTAVYDEEDAAISTFRVLCDKLREGAYPDLADRDELWHLLLTMLARKINRRVAYEGAGKRGQPASLNPSEDQSLDPIDWRTLTDQSSQDCRELLEKLADERLEQVAMWKLEGYSNAEIAVKLNRTRRTVQRMVDLIKEVWVLV